MNIVGYNSYSQDLKLCFDQRNARSWNGSLFYDLVTGADSNNIGDPAWLNNIGYLTISVVIQRYTTTAGYADHPIAKWNGTLQNASIILYNFGAGSDGTWQFYAGNGSWTGVAGGGFLTMGAMHHIVLQYNAIDGGQSWFNGSKNGGRATAGILGNSHSSSTSGLGFEGASPNGNGHTKMYHLSMWNRELPDDEIVRQYTQLKGAYGVV